MQLIAHVSLLSFAACFASAPAAIHWMLLYNSWSMHTAEPSTLVTDQAGT